ncbi:TPA: HNH endonuclease [Streptococcus pyogenes]|nr:HNH endonuclease [Streptococcus pyogenes]
MEDSVRRKSISKKTRQLVLEKYDCHCAYCGKILDIKTLRVDHLEPFRNGGADDISNFMPACQSCNFYKSTHTLEMFRKQLKTIHERIMKPFISRLGEDYGIVEIKPFDGKFYFEKTGNGG